MREPRGETICRIVTEALRHSGDSEEAFAARVVDLYQQRTALHERVVEFHAGSTSDTVIEAQRANAQLIRRMLRGVVRLPIDLEESIVLALPGHYLQRALSELSGRYGLLAVPEPSTDPQRQLSSLADLSREFGEAVQRVAPMLADGRIDGGDRRAAGPALRELRELLAATQGLIHQIQASVQPAGCVAPIRSARQ